MGVKLLLSEQAPRPSLWFALQGSRHRAFGVWPPWGCDEGSWPRAFSPQGNPLCPLHPGPSPPHPGGLHWNVTPSSGSVLVQCGQTCVLPGPAVCLLGCDRHAPCPLSGRLGAVAARPLCCFGHPAALREASALRSRRRGAARLPFVPGPGALRGVLGHGGDLRSCLATGPAGRQRGLGSRRPVLSLVWRLQLGRTRDVFPLRPSEVGAQSAGFRAQL